MLVIGSIIRNREWILPRYLKGIDNLDYNKKDITLVFLVNDSEDESLNILLRYKDQNESKYARIDVIEFNTGVQEYDREVDARNITFRNMATLRNKLLERVISYSPQYFFSIDSDIIPPPNILKDLITDDKDVVAAHVWNNKECTLPNYMNKGLYQYHHIRGREPGLFECDLTGAVILIKGDVLINGVRYGYHPTGEDAVFCKEAKKLGYGVWVDSRIQCEHIMSKE